MCVCVWCSHRRKRSPSVLADSLLNLPFNAFYDNFQAHNVGGKPQWGGDAEKNNLGNEIFHPGPGLTQNRRLLSLSISFIAFIWIELSMSLNLLFTGTGTDSFTSAFAFDHCNYIILLFYSFKLISLIIIVQNVILFNCMYYLHFVANLNEKWCHQHH